MTQEINNTEVVNTNLITRVLLTNRIALLEYPALYGSFQDTNLLLATLRVVVWNTHIIQAAIALLCRES